MRICVILSLIAHLLLAGYAATIHIAGSATGLEGEVVEVALGDAFLGKIEPARPDKPWQQFPGRAGEIPPLTVPRMDEAEIPETDYVPAAPEQNSAERPLVPANLQAAAPVAAAAPQTDHETALAAVLHLCKTSALLRPATLALASSAAVPSPTAPALD